MIFRRKIQCPNCKSFDTVVGTCYRCENCGRFLNDSKKYRIDCPICGYYAIRLADYLFVCKECGMRAICGIKEKGNGYLKFEWISTF